MNADLANAIFDKEKILDQIIEIDERISGLVTILKEDPGEGRKIVLTIKLLLDTRNVFAKKIGEAELTVDYFTNEELPGTAVESRTVAIFIKTGVLGEEDYLYSNFKLVLSPYISDLHITYYHSLDDLIDAIFKGKVMGILAIQPNEYLSLEATIRASLMTNYHFSRNAAGIHILPKIIDVKPPYDLEKVALSAKSLINDSLSFEKVQKTGPNTQDLYWCKDLMITLLNPVKVTVVDSQVERNEGILAILKFWPMLEVRFILYSGNGSGFPEIPKDTDILIINQSMAVIQKIKKNGFSGIVISTAKKVESGFCGYHFNGAAEVNFDRRAMDSFITTLMNPALKNHLFTKGRNK